MININRTNYEEYFLLYNDNELNAAERQVIEEFVQQNPDLADELMTLQLSRLRPEEDVVFRNKESLIQFDDVIHTANYEEFFLLYADNELTNRQKAQVEQFVYNHPQYQSAFEFLQEIRMTPDSSALFPDKESLHRHEQGRPMALGWWKVAAAAIVVLFGGIVWLNNNRNGQPSDGKIKVITQKSPSANHNIKQGSDKGLPLTDKAGIKGDAPSVLQQTTRPVEKFKKDHTVNPAIASIETSQEEDNRQDHPKQQDRLARLEKKEIGSLATSTGRNADTESLVDSIDASIANHTGKTPIDQPALKTDDNNSTASPEDIGFASNDNDENVILSNINTDSKHSLRVLFRKASRLINKGSSLKSGQKQGILIGNIEIAFQ
ncbi:MAG: hypothetical protein WKF97_01515 [Chitinophagaceae bacterium]